MRTAFLRFATVFRIAITSLGFVFAVAPLCAQPGTIDLTFAHPVDSLGDSTRFNDVVNTICEQADGKILVGGNFTRYNSRLRSRIVRLTADGIFDPSFLITTGFSGKVKTIVVDTGGRIYAGGFFTNYNGTYRSNLIRLLPDGSADLSFALGTAFDDSVNTIVVQPDNKIIVGGNFTTYNGSPANRIVRLNTDGSVDTTFVTGTGFNNAVFALTLQPDGKVLAGGAFTNYGIASAPRITRLNTDGTKDNTFNAGNGCNGNVMAIILQPGGKIIAGGAFTTYNFGSHGRIVSLDSLGTSDANFPLGIGFNSPVYALTSAPGGAVLAGGSFVSFNGNPCNRILQLTATGSVDPSFLFEGGADGTVLTFAKAANTDILIGGNFTTCMNTDRNRIARIKTSGWLDNSFATNYGFKEEQVLCITTQSDGRILVGGNFERYNGWLSPSMIRLFDDGSIDTSFHTPFTYGDVYSIVIDTAINKIYVGSAFSGPVNEIARLNMDGSPDTSFAIGNGFNYGVYKLAVQPDGKILAGGFFTAFDFQPVNYVIRLHRSGKIDSSFYLNTYPGLNNQVFDIALQPDSNIVLSGMFSTFNGDSNTRVVRLHTTGAVDTSFHSGIAPVTCVNRIKLQPDGKILMTETTNPGTGSGKVRRLNSNGSLDNTFTTYTLPFSWEAYAIELQPDGRFLIGGGFSNFYGYHGLVRFNANGIIDSSFINTSPAYSLRVYSLHSRPGNKILVGGSFLKYSGWFINRLTRLHLGGSSVTAGITKTDVNCFGQNTGSATVNVTSGIAPFTYQWTGGGNTPAITNLAAGNYTVTVTDAGSATVSASVSIAQPAALNATITVTHVNCFGGSNGSIDITVTGGTGVPTYIWSPAINPDINLSAGTYNVTITDENLCSITTSATVNEPASALSATASTTPTTCGQSTGTATVTPAGGTAGYTVSWNTSPVQTSLTATGLNAGNYTVTVTDTNGCTATASTVVIAPGSPTATFSTTDVSCFGGSDGGVSVIVSGGTPPISFAWTPSSSVEDLVNVAAGNYSLVITDSALCTFSLAATVNQPPQLSLTTAITNVSCFGTSTGSLDLIVTGGTGISTYNWTPAASTEDRNNIAAGTYTVTVTDANSCTVTTSATISQPTALSVVAASTPNTGIAVAAANGGTLSYTYVWSTTPAQTNSTASGLTPGTYTVTVTDANSCTATASVAVLIVGIAEAENERIDFSLFPNPANDNLIVVMELNDTRSVCLNVMDITGKLIYTSKENITGKVNREINVTGFSSGVYVFEAIADRQIVRKIFSVSR